MTDRLVMRLAVGAAVVLTIVAALSWTYSKGWQAREAVAVADALKASEKARKQERKAQVITERVSTAHEAKAVQIRTVYRDIIREVPVYVTAQADAACVVPAGFVRVHDAAAAGRVPGPPGQSDDAASGVAISAASGVIVQNYGTYAEVSQRLTDLQAWVKAQRGNQ
jgi:hypothetical protein